MFGAWPGMFLGNVGNGRCLLHRLSQVFLAVLCLLGGAGSGSLGTVSGVEPSLLQQGLSSISERFRFEVSSLCRLFAISRDWRGRGFDRTLFPGGAAGKE